jgi:hypothetical protein
MLARAVPLRARKPRKSLAIALGSGRPRSHRWSGSRGRVKSDESFEAKGSTDPAASWRSLSPRCVRATAGFDATAVALARRGAARAGVTASDRPGVGEKEWRLETPRARPIRPAAKRITGSPVCTGAPMKSGCQGQVIPPMTAPHSPLAVAQPESGSHAADRSFPSRHWRRRAGLASAPSGRAALFSSEVLPEGLASEPEPVAVLSPRLAPGIVARSGGPRVSCARRGTTKKGLY